MASNSTAKGYDNQALFHGATAVKKKLCVASGELVYNLPWQLVSVYLAFFMTDIAMIPAAATSILFLIARCWDAVNDPLIGSLADRTRSKMGRYRPWMLVGSIGLLPLCVLLFWAHPTWPEAGRTAYGCILYIAIVVFSTCWNIPFCALNGCISPYPTERASFSSYRIMFSSAACGLSVLIFQSLIPVLSGPDGNAIKGYVLSALIVCLIAVPFIFTSIRGTREAFQPPAQQKYTAKQMLKSFTQNPPLLIVCVSFFVYGFLNYGRSAVGMYYFTYVWGDAGLFMIYGTFVAFICAGAAFFSAAIVKLFKGKRNALLMTYAVGAAINMICFFITPSNSSGTMELTFLLLTGVTNGMTTALLYAIIGDATDYGQWKTGTRADGLCSSGTSFMMKLGGAIAPTILLALLAATGYVANAEAQTAEALGSMNVMMNLVPAILCAVSFVLYLFYKLDDKLHAQIMSDLKERGQLIMNDENSENS